jgi:hypothetical protein
MKRQLIALLIVASPLAAIAALSVTIEHTDATCNYANGFAQAVVTGGQQPLHLPVEYGRTDQRSLPGSGCYSVLVTDALGEQVVAEVTIGSAPYELLGGGGYAFCTGPTNVFEAPAPEGQSVGPWYVDDMPVWSMDDGSGRYSFPVSGISGQVHTISDANGCTGTITESPVWPVSAWPEVTVTQVEPSLHSLR